MVLYDFKQRSDSELRVFKHYPDIADYFTSPVDFIYNKSMELTIDYDHIIDDNYERFVTGLKIFKRVDFLGQMRYANNRFRDLCILYL